jgi:CHAT domain-containing protein
MKFCYAKGNQGAIHPRYFFSLSLCLWLFFLGPCFSVAFANNVFATAEQQVQNGFYHDAFSSYEQALADAEQTASIHQQQLAKAGLGHTLYLLNQPEQAVDYLVQALTLSNQAEDPINGQIHYYLSLVHKQLEDTESAKMHWKNAMRIAKQHADTVLQAYLLLAAIKWETDKTHLDQQLEQLEALLSPEKKHANSQIWGIIHLNIAEHLIQHRLFGVLLSTDRSRIRRIHEHIQKAEHFLPETALRPRSQMDGLMSFLYETDSRYNEALILNRQAIALAEKASAQDLLILHEWQMGRLYEKLRQRETAIDSYRRAISHVGAIRQDIPVQYQDGKSSFNELLRPLYQQSIDLLLQETASMKNTDQKQALFSEVHEFLEQFKQTELEDFLQDRCINRDDKEFSLDQIEAGVAVLYPVLFTGRFEWLVLTNGQWQQISIALPSDDLTLSGDALSQRIIKMTAAMRNRIDHFFHREELYRLLFGPLETILQNNKIKTLVYVPDGIMRLLPLGMLYDNSAHKHLIERYAIVTSPGLSLLEMRTNLPKKAKSLLAGLSEPTMEMLAHLPEATLTGFMETAKNTNLNQVAMMRSFSDHDTAQDNKTRISNESAEALHLPQVAVEINQLREIFPNQSVTLLNKDFTLRNFQAELEQSNYDIVHIASHGYFGKNATDSFIMTYDNDERLELDMLEQLLNKQKQGNAINMLTLSACETAEGNDRAPMGFSGAALKANAQTVLGSLWKVDDAATAELMKIFYQQLINKRYSKAKALQEAQKELIKSKKWSNPYHWAPFILVGHWQ